MEHAAQRIEEQRRTEPLAAPAAIDPEAPEQGDRDRIARQALHGAFGQGLALDAARAQGVEPRNLLERVGDRDEDPRHVAPGVLRCLAAKVAVQWV